MTLVVVFCMILAAAFLLRSEWEKLQLAKTFLRLRTEKPLGYPPAGSTADEKLRLLFISDLHEYAPVMHRMDEVLEKIRTEKVDAVLIGGDMITVSRHRKKKKPDMGTALTFVTALAKEYPVYYGEGNHEVRLRGRDPVAYAEYVEALLKAGVRYLSDQSVRLTIRGTQTNVMIHGISLEEMFFQPRPGFGLDMTLPEGYLKDKLPDFDRGRYNILLLHSPAFLKECAEIGADLVLSGHIHGGTIRLPGGIGLMSPQYRYFVRECAGSFREGEAVMAVTRGLGTHSIKIRFHNLPELMVLEITRENTGPSEER